MLGALNCYFFKLNFATNPNINERSIKTAVFIIPTSLIDCIPIGLSQKNIIIKNVIDDAIDNKILSLFIFLFIRQGFINNQLCAIIYYFFCPYTIYYKL